MKKLYLYPLIVALSGLLFCSKPSSERIVSLDGYDLHLKDNGTGEPAVIIEVGLGMGLIHYDTLQTLVSEFTRVISYDHAGIGKSTKSPNPRTLPNYVKELRQLLDHEKIKPPYIFVGHSLGGLIIRYYTHLYEGDIAGLVFIDVPHEDWFKYIRNTHSPEDLIKFNNVFDPTLNQSTGVVKEEWEQADLNFELIRGIMIPRQTPVRMLTAIRYDEMLKNVGYHPDDMKVWAEMQKSILDNLEDAKQIITENSGHSIHVTEPNLVVNAIKELVENYRKSR